MKAGIVKADEVVGDGHCIAPRFLADQLDRSRANLGVETIDVYYVHNPETQLGAVDQATFQARMRAAFEFLEGAVTDGKIRCYGGGDVDRLPPARDRARPSLAARAGRPRAARWRATGTTSA